MENSILNSIKYSLGIQKDLTAFDQDILMNINSVFSVLDQLGVPFSTNSYHIENSDATWIDIFGENYVLTNLIYTYTYLKVKILFDPPSSSYVLDAFKTQAQELEWRINIEAEGGLEKHE